MSHFSMNMLEDDEGHIHFFGDDDDDDDDPHFNSSPMTSHSTIFDPSEFACWREFKTGESPCNYFLVQPQNVSKMMGMMVMMVMVMMMMMLEWMWWCVG